MRIIHLYILLLVSLILSSYAVTANLLEVGLWAGFVITALLWVGIYTSERK